MPRPRTRRRFRLAATLARATIALSLHLAVTALGPGEARAAPPVADEASRNAARGFAAEGDALYKDGDYKGAADRFERAFALVQAPTVGVRWARALAKMGKLIEAEERYVATVRIDLGDSPPDPFRVAVSEATTELAELRRRLPKLEIVRPAGVGEVRLDGKAVPDALIGVPRPVNPGSHVVEADGASKKSVSVREGEVIRVELEATGEGGGSGDTQRTAGWIALGVGGVGLGIGIVLGIVALGAKGTLDDNCESSGACGPEYASDLDTFHTAGTLATIGFVVGGIGAATGAILLLTAGGSPKAQRGASVSPWIGPASVGLRGVF